MDIQRILALLPQSDILFVGGSSYANVFPNPISGHAQKNVSFDELFFF